ncbi:MAG TPA: TonB-dependent receptor [Phenylobacterium sp.]
MGYRRIALFIGASTVALGGMCQTAAAQAASGGPVIEEVVVTARRLAENLQEVPVAVTALSGDQLDKRAMGDLRDIARFTPNVYFSNIGSQSPEQSAIYIRGVGQSDAFATSDQGVGLYVDGVYYSRPQGGIMDLVDLERIEVLRGPQGTLFGKNTSGGAINVISKAPDPEGGGKVALTYGNLGRVELAATASIPISDTLTLKISGLGKHRDCLTRRAWDNACYGDINKVAGRGYLRWTPTSGLIVDVIGDITKGYSHVRPHQLVDYQIVGAIAAWNQRLNDPVNFPGLTGVPFTLSDPGAQPASRYATDGDAPTDAPITARGLSMHAQWTLGDATLHSITAYRDVNHPSQESTYAHRGAPTTVWSLSKANWFSQEFRADGSMFDGRLNYVAGLYYFTEDGTTNEMVNRYKELNLGTVNFNDQTTNSYAAFANLSYGLTDKLRVSGGVRFTKEKKEWTAKFVQLTSIAALKPGLNPAFILRSDPTNYPNALNIPASPAFTKRDDSWSPVTPRIGLDYQVTDDLLLFANAARGFRSGGYNGRASALTGTAAYDPEYTTSYEAGFKADFLDRRVRLNATGYYTDYKDLQQTVLTCARDAAGNCMVSGGLPVFAPLVTNAASAVIYGGEAELTALVTRALRVEASVGYTHARFKDVDASATAATGLSENSVVPNVPEWTAAVSAEYRFETSFGSITPRVDYTYRDTVYFRIDSFRYGSGLPASPRSTEKPVELVNATVTFQPTNDDWEAVFYVRNLTDNVYRLWTNDLTKVGVGTGTLQELSDPREYGVTVTRRF